MNSPDIYREFTVYSYFSALSDMERKSWAQWALRHGLDLDDLVLPCWIERQPADYRVTYLGAARDAKGAYVLNTQQDDIVREVRFVQLEGPPLPFPDPLVTAGVEP